MALDASTRRVAQWIGLSLILVAIGTAIAAETNTVLLAAAAGLGTVLLALRPKLLAATAACVAIFDTGAQQFLDIGRLTLVDDAAVLAAVAILPTARLASGRRLRGLPGGRWFLAYLALGLVSSLRLNAPTAVTAEGAFLALKGVAFGFALAQIDWSRDDLRRVVRFAGAVATVVVACAAVNEAIPHWWAVHFAGSGTSTYRLGFPSLVGPFTGPGPLGEMAALTAIAALAYWQAFPRSRWSLALLACSALSCVATLRRKAVAGLLAGLAATWGRRDRTAVLVTATVVTPAVLLLLWGDLKGLARFTSNEYRGRTARATLYHDSVDIANDAFPLGAGFGRFGTHTAIAHYSPLYRARGYASIWGLQPSDEGSGHYASDTFWPGVAGETGWLGLVAFAGGLVAIVRWLRRCPRDDPWLVFLASVGVGWSLEYAIESVASPNYVSPPMYPLLFGLAGLATSYLDVRRDEVDGAAGSSSQSGDAPARADA